jgi:hypothetical protein
MRRRVSGTILGGLILALVPFLSSAADAAPQAAPVVSHPVHHSCATARAGYASCNALVRDDVATSVKALRAAAAAPSGL